MGASFFETGLPVLVVLAALCLWVYGVVDFARADDVAIRTFPKEAWILILLFGSFAGALMWFIAGRPRRP
ncbi:hypothetical protein B5P43_13600 [Bacillus sp. SRB_336]|nr:hypothetical protein B5P43_13600 [Bacillus sp. SRB_336]